MQAKIDPAKLRRSVRLKGYDYSQEGAYFVTVCTHNRECLLGEIIDGEMQPSSFGEIVQMCWADLPRHYPCIELDAFVITPNHVHGIITIVGAGFKPAPTHGLPEIVRAFKTFSARHINESRHAPGTPFWQRNYYDHVIHDEKELNAVRQYILDNPARWAEDEDNPCR